MPILIILLLCGLTGIAVAAAIAGIRLTHTVRLARRAVPFSAGVLLGMAGFWVFPELGLHFGWTSALPAILGGVLTLWLIDHFLYPVCPTCSHTHDHGHCAMELHGFALPLVAAAAFHSLFDGTAIAATAGAQDSGFSTALTIGLALHKVPEGVALGVILHSAMRSRAVAILAVTLAESATIAGGLLESVLAPYLGANWANLLLALAGGSFLYLGWHALHTEWKRRGAAPSFVPALAGTASAALLRYGVHLMPW